MKNQYILKEVKKKNTKDINPRTYSFHNNVKTQYDKIIRNNPSNLT